MPHLRSAQIETLENALGILAVLWALGSYSVPLAVGIAGAGLLAFNRFGRRRT